MLPTVMSFAGRVPTLLLHAAWQAGLLGLLVFAVTWLLGSRVAPRWRFALWLIVFARLALPVLPSAPWSLFQLVGEVTVDRPLAGQPVEPTRVDNWLNQRAPMTEPWPEGSREDESVRPRTTMTRDTRPLATRISLSSIATAVWAVVTLGLLLRLITSRIKLRRLQRAWQPIRDGMPHALLQQCRQNMGIRRHVELYATLDNLGPATCGVFQPRIILSNRLLAALSSQELRLVLLHELVHVQRHDVLIDLCVTLIASVHWFHPVGWLARYFLRRERELACDAAVLDHSEAIASADYGDVLLKAVESLTTPAPLAGVVGMLGQRQLSLLRRRIQLIADYRRSTRLGLVGGAALVAGLALIGLTDAQSRSPTEEGTQKSAAAARTNDGQVGEAAPSLPSPKSNEVTIEVRYADTGEPVAGALVGAYIQIGTNNSWGQSDGRGNVTLNLSPDEYTLWSHPPKGQDYLSVHSKFIVHDTADKQAAELKLPPACVLVLKAIDADTGEGIEGVTFWYEEELIYKRWSVQSNDTTNDFPATDASGVLRALVAPGERTYGLPFNPLPGNYRAGEADIRGRRLTLTPGQTVTEEFQLRSTGKSDKSGAAVTPANLPAAETAPPSPIPPPAPYKLSVSRRVEPPGEPAAVTVSGRALDERGRPIEGAQIYLINANLGAPEKMAAEAVTDAAGRYEFRDAKLEGLGASEIEGSRRSYTAVYFRLAGIAPGRAFAWRGMKHIYLDRDEAVRAGAGRTNLARPDLHQPSFAPWEKIELDLTFLPPQPISGRLVDEAGQPVRGAAVRLQACFRQDSAGRAAYDHEYFCPNPTHWKAPPPVANSIYAKTDDDGRFTLPGGPPGVQCDLGVSHPDFAPLTVCVSTADRPPQTNRNNEPMLPLPLDLKLRSQRTITVTVQRHDSGAPIAEARVWVNEIASAGGTRSGSYGGCELDKNGQGKMKLPPGKFRLVSSLWRESYIHQQDQELIVADSPAEQSLVIKMQPDRTR